MWTLLMDQGTNDLWKLLAGKFVTDTAPPVGGISLLPTSVDAQAVKVSWRVVDYATGVDRYNVQVRDIGSTTWTAWLTGTHATSGWYAGQAGRTYEFRVQAIDLKGNAQAWVSVPAQPASVVAGAFARVTTGALNVRSGAGTSFGIVGSLAAGSVVYVLDGPVASGDYQWYRVQYGFTEWPAAGYAQIGWVAAGSGSETYLAPAGPPTRVKLAPFVAGYAVTPSFLPTGPAPGNVATVSYSLSGPVAAARMEVVDAAGAVRRTIGLGSQAAGAHAVAWNGRSDGGSVLPAGRYLLRIVVSEAGGAAHAAPSPSTDAALVATLGTVLKLSPFTDIAGSPFRGDIEWLYASAITRGCSSTAFCPDDPVLRDQMATFLVRGFKLPATTIDFFTDDATSQHQSAINALAASGITSGCAATRYCPGASVTREQMASFLARALHLPATSVDYFDDDDGSAHEGDINRVAAAGVTAGCGARKYCPGAVVTRGQMAAFLRRSLTP
jgi:hypothetical protein